MARTIILPSWDRYSQNKEEESPNDLDVGIVKLNKETLTFQFQCRYCGKKLLQEFIPHIQEHWHNCEDNDLPHKFNMPEMLCEQSGTKSQDAIPSLDSQFNDLTDVFNMPEMQFEQSGTKWPDAIPSLDSQFANFSLFTDVKMVDEDIIEKLVDFPFLGADPDNGAKLLEIGLLDHNMLSFVEQSTNDIKNNLPASETEELTESLSGLVETSPQLNLECANSVKNAKPTEGTKASFDYRDMLVDTTPQLSLECTNFVQNPMQTEDTEEYLNEYLEMSSNMSLECINDDSKPWIILPTLNDIQELKDLPTERRNILCDKPVLVDTSPQLNLNKQRKLTKETAKASSKTSKIKYRSYTDDNQFDDNENSPPTLNSLGQQKYELCPRFNCDSNEYRNVEFVEDIWEDNNSKTSKDKTSKDKTSKDNNCTTQLPCQMCSQVFKNERLFNAHSKTHSSKTLYECKICKREFTDASNCRVHMRRHLSLKPHKCNVCNKAFTSSSEMKSHSRTHNGERPYLCITCKKAFATSSQLKSHELRHTNDPKFHCDKCTKKFYEQRLLDEHYRYHTREFPFPCSFCHHKYKRLRTLKVHIKRKHENDQKK